ncbi:MAG: DUF5615 family PIN-like protein [Chloroflexota bacterium]
MHPLRFLVDFNVGRFVTDDLISQGYDVKFIGDLDPRMLDEAILTLAVKEQRLILTMDNDFGELVYQSGQKHAGVLLLRMPGAGRTQKARVTRQILAQYADQLEGSYAVYKGGRLRIRGKK